MPRLAGFITACGGENPRIVCISYCEIGKYSAGQRRNAPRHLHSERNGIVDISLARGAHACHIFTSPDEQKRVLLSFCSDGLNRNQCCLLTAAPETATCWHVELEAHGIDVQEEIGRGSLIIKAVRGPSEDFNPLRQTRELWRIVEPSLDRFNAVRLLREQPWSSDLALSVESLCHFELTRNLLFEDTEVRSICQYDLTNHPPAAIHTALRTHPLVILHGKVHENSFYDGPAILEREPWAFGTDASAAQVEQMLAHFR